METIFSLSRGELHLSTQLRKCFFFFPSVAFKLKNLLGPCELTFYCVKHFMFDVDKSIKNGTNLGKQLS